MSDEPGISETKESRIVMLSQQLKRRGNLWWTPDGEMYVYYTPTHWKPVT